jgi:chlorite dismutase
VEIYKYHVVNFIGGNIGQWKVSSIRAVTGMSLDLVSYINIVENGTHKTTHSDWTLKGFSSNLRYAERAEKERLLAIQEGLGRSNATCAALIPIRKNEMWWALAQDERRAIFENKSHHTETGIKYLPAIARKLYHCRDLGGPFDFLTWFEYAPSDSEPFEELVHTLRKTEEWKYVDREVDIRLVRND